MKWIPYVEVRESTTRQIIGIIEGSELEFNYTWNGCGDFEIYCRATPNNLNLLKIGRYVTLPNEVDYSYNVQYIIVNGVNYYCHGGVLYTTYSNGAYSGGVSFEYSVELSDDNKVVKVVIDGVEYFPQILVDSYCNIWRIQKIQRQNDRIGGRYIIATGKEAKCIVGNRIIRYMAVMEGGLVSSVKDILFKQNITEPIDENRKIPELEFNSSDFEIVMKETNTTTGEDEETRTQVTYDNLLDYTESLYAAYNVGAKLRLNRTNLKLYYTIYQGLDRSKTVVFSQVNENLLNTDYSEDWTNYKTYALVGGEETEQLVKDEETGEVIETIKGARKVNSIDDGSKGVDRYEVFIDARDVSSTYQTQNEQGVEVEKTMTDPEYKALLKAKGKETMASEYKKEIFFDGEIDTTNKRYKFNEDYYLGDFVSIRDDDFGETKKVQVTKQTRIQNMEGYKEYFSHTVEEV